MKNINNSLYKFPSLFIPVSSLAPGKRTLNILAFLLVFLATGLSNVAQSQCFTNMHGEFSLEPSVGANARAMVLADFNLDGLSDMAVVHENTHTLSVALGKIGGERFGAPKDIPVYNSPGAVAAGDFNGDKKPDIIVALLGSDEIRVFLNNGAGGFSLAASLETPSGGAMPSAIAVADLNKDGNLDAIVNTGNSNRIQVLLGTGMGDFLPPNSYTVGTLPTHIAVGDFNSDGKQDLAVTNSGTNNVSILINKGILGFYPAFNYYVGSNPRDAVTADFNGDGTTDLAIVNGFSSSVTVMLTNAVGTFTIFNDYAVGNGPYSMEAGDINGDGKPDLAVANSFSNTISVLLNNGAGGFLPASNTSTGSGDSPWDVALKDINLDGKTDILVVKPSTTIVHVMLQHKCPNTPPFQTKPTPNLIATLGEQFSYTYTPDMFSDAETPNNITLLVSGLPAGLAFTPPGTISGIPSGKTGQFKFDLKYSDLQGYAILSGGYISVMAAPSNATAPKVNNAIPSQTATVGEAFNYVIPANTFSDVSRRELSLTVTGLPAGLVFVAPSTITGTPTARIEFPVQVTVTATNLSRMSARTNFALTVQEKKANPYGPRARFAAGESEAKTTLKATGFPNPVVNDLGVNIEGIAGQRVRLLLVDLNGRPVADKTVQITEDNQREVVQMSQNEAGLYILKVSTATQTQTVKVLKR